VNRKRIDVIKGYANRVHALRDGLKLPQFPPGTPASVSKEAERQIGAVWLKEAMRLLQDEWPAIRHFFEKDAPQAVQPLSELRRAILGEAKQEPYGRINHLEPRTDRPVPGDELQSPKIVRLVPDEVLRPLIDEFVRELRDQADLAGVSFPRRLCGFFASRSLWQKVVAGIIVALLTAFLIPQLAAYVSRLKDPHGSASTQGPSDITPVVSGDTILNSGPK
jgi:hypothetical protein